MAVIERETPLHIRISKKIEAGIADGSIPADENGILPSQTWFAENMGVGISTVSHAIKELEQAGLVESRKRKGLILKNRPSVGTVSSVGTDILHFGVAFFQGFSNIKHTTTSNILMGIESYASEANVALHISCFPGIKSEMDIAEEVLFTAYEKQSVDGMILLSVVSPQSYVRLLESGIPFVMTSYCTEEWVVCHSKERIVAFSKMIGSLLSKGCENIVLFTGSASTLSAYEKLSVYRSELEKNGIAFRPEYVSADAYDHNAAIAFVRNLLDSNAPIDAVIGFDDIMAFKIAKYLNSVGRSDILIGGSGNYEEYADLVHVTIDHHYDVIGYNAAKMLADMARGKKFDRTKYYYDSDLIERYP